MQRLLRAFIFGIGFSSFILAAGCADVAEPAATRPNWQAIPQTASTWRGSSESADASRCAMPKDSAPGLNQPAPACDDQSADALTLTLPPAGKSPHDQSPQYLNAADESVKASRSEEISLGEDFTKPQKRIDVRLQYEDLDRGNDRYTQTTRIERPFYLTEHWTLGLRADVPVIEGNDAFSSKESSGYYTGLGDVLTQYALIDSIDNRWIWGFGAQMIFPSATSKEFGDGNYRAVPTVGVRCALPEISQGSYCSPLMRYDVDYAGREDRRGNSVLEFAPELNIKLARDWYIDFYPSTDIRYNCLTQKWFVPVDVQIGRRITPAIVASLEGSLPIIKDYNYYNSKIEFRIGWFY